MAEIFSEKEEIFSHQLKNEINKANENLKSDIPNNFITENGNQKESFNFPRYIHTYYQYGYYLGFIPFRLVYEQNGGNGKYVQQYNTKQKIICAINAAGLAFFSILMFFRQISTTVSLRTPDSIFFCTTNICYTSMTFVCIFTYWRFANRFADIVNISNPGNPEVKLTVHRSKPHKGKILLIILICVLYTLLVCFNDLYVKQWAAGLFGSQIRSFTHKNLWLIFLRDIENDDAKDYYKGEFHIGIYILNFTTMYFFFIRNVMINWLQLAPLFMGISIHEVTSRLLEKMKENNLSVQSKLWIFAESKKSIAVINLGIKRIILWIFTASFALCSRSFFFVFEYDEITGMRIHYAFFIANIVVSYLIAAEAFDKGKTAKELLFMALRKYPQQYPEMLCLEATSYQMGLQGGSFFTVTYGFLGMTASILFTYCLVMIQLSLSTEVKQRLIY